jgi:hypothetical protein
MISQVSADAKGKVMDHLPPMMFPFLFVHCSPQGMKKAARSRLGLMYVFRHHGAISIIRKRWVNIVNSRENGTATYCAFPSSEAPHEDTRFNGVDDSVRTF